MEHSGWLRDRRYLRPSSFEPSDEQLLAFETRVRGRIMYDPGEKEPARGSRPLCSKGLLRRRDGGDGLQAEGNDLGTDHFARNDQFDAAVLLAAFGGIV